MIITSNGFKIPDSPNGSSTDNYGDIINAIINNTNICNTTKGQLSGSQSDYNQGYWKSTDGFIIQWGHPQINYIVENGGQAKGSITFPTSFPHVCLTVVGSDAGGEGMGFGFYGLNSSGCSWCTCAGVGSLNKGYSPNYIAIGW